LKAGTYTLPPTTLYRQQPQRRNHNHNAGTYTLPPTTPGRRNPFEGRNLFKNSIPFGLCPLRGQAAGRFSPSPHGFPLLFLRNICSAQWGQALALPVRAGGLGEPAAASAELIDHPSITSAYAKKKLGGWALAVTRSRPQLNQNDPTANPKPIQRFNNGICYKVGGARRAPRSLPG